MNRKTPRNVAEYLSASGCTQAELATRLGITQGHMSQIVNGQRMPRPKLALLIAQVTGVPVEAMLKARAEQVA